MSSELPKIFFHKDELDAAIDGVKTAEVRVDNATVVAFHTVGVNFLFNDLFRGRTTGVEHFSDVDSLVRNRFSRAGEILPGFNGTEEQFRRELDQRLDVKAIPRDGLLVFDFNTK